FVCVFVCAVPCGIFWETIFVWLAKKPLVFAQPLPSLIYTAPAETVMLSLKIAFVGGFVLACPFIFWRLWLFIAPALYSREKRVIFRLVFFTTICFLSGFMFCYAMFPFMLKFLTGFAGDTIEPMFKIDEYIGFLLKMSFSFGCVFELPVLAFVLTKFGVIDHRFLLKYFRYIIVAIFILAACITPPDILSQVVVAVPLLLLYSVSIFVAFVNKPKGSA
ncbi:MAG: twin-arginine translocase subunit TatC, partial [Candidatus Cloacimonetes bacterium]|nr:twin-arginine translocase subunit TatC [Candidatus Cloacimonadota bacterium]